MKRICVWCHKQAEADPYYCNACLAGENDYLYMDVDAEEANNFLIPLLPQQPQINTPQFLCICGNPVRQQGLTCRDCNQRVYQERRKTERKVQKQEKEILKTRKCCRYCDRPAQIRGLCRMHNKRIQRTGSPYRTEQAS